MKKILIKLGLIAAVLASMSIYQSQVHAQEQQVEDRDSRRQRAEDRERGRDREEQDKLEEEMARRDEILRRERGDLEQANDHGPLQDRVEPKDEEPAQETEEVEQDDVKAGSAVQFPNGSTKAGYSTIGGGCALGLASSDNSLLTSLIWGLAFLAPMLRAKKLK